MSLFDREPRLSHSEFLSVIVERDAEAPDDPKAWVVVAACEGEVPEHFGAGYLHAPDCACVKEDGRLCNVGWLEEFVSCGGVAPLLEGVDPIPPGRLKLQGRLVSERIEGVEGTDYDERFECYSAEAMPLVFVESNIEVGRLYTDEHSQDGRGYGVVVVTKIDAERVEFTGPEVVELEARFWITPDDFMRWFTPLEQN